MSSSSIADPCVAMKATYELKGTQTTDSDSEDGCDSCMDIAQVESGGVSVLPDKLIKIENRATVVEGNAGQVIPYAPAGIHIPSAGIHIPSAKNGVFYFPTQAMLAPRQPYPAFVTNSPCTHLSSIRLSHKRRTIEALAEGALMNTQEATLFQETIESAKTIISVFDNDMKMEVSHDVLRKEDAVITDQPLDNTVGSPRRMSNDEEFAKIVSCYSLQQVQDSNSTTTTETEGMICTSLVTCSPSIITNTSSTVVSNQTEPGTRSETTPGSISTTVSQIDEKQTQVDIRSVNHVASSSNQKPSSLELAKIHFNKTLSKELETPTHKTLPCTVTLPNASIASNICAIPSTSARSESTQKFYSPKGGSQVSDDSPARPVYVPKEIKPSSVELGLDECVNVKDICDKELTKWSCEDVAKFVRATDCSEYADTFIEQEIDGKALMLLNQDLLIQWMKLKLGPAMKLYSHILTLKHALHNRPQSS